MIIPDINLLVYAYNADAKLHSPARRWFEELMSADEPVGMPWMVVCGFVRIMTHPSILLVPLELCKVLDHVRSWLELAHVQVLEPGPRHLEFWERALKDAGVGGNLVTDAHIAALGLEYQAQVHTNDADFARFAGLRWRNPLKDGL